MTISNLNPSLPRSAAPRASQAPAAETPGDRVEIGPRLMAGVPTGYLVPEIPPANLFTPTVGIEIVPGLGLSLDGKALLVGQKGTSENLEIIGHLPGQEGGAPILYPQRDFKVSHQGDQTTVDGHFGWQDYSLRREGGSVTAQGETPRESFVTQERADGFDVSSQFAARTWHVQTEGNVAHVRSDYAEGLSYTVTQNGNQTVVDSGHPEVNYTLTRQADGSITVDGALNPQDFRISQGPEGLVVQGHYAHQRFVISPS